MYTLKSATVGFFDVIPNSQLIIILLFLPRRYIMRIDDDTDLWINQETIETAEDRI
jgi:hypothetical protein